MASLGDTQVFGDLSVKNDARVEGELDLSNATVAGLSKSDVGLGNVQNRNINISTSAPSSGDGSDGDIWFVV